MNFVFGVMFFFIVLGFVLSVCNAVSSERAKEHRQVDILIATILFALFIVLVRVTGV